MTSKRRSLLRNERGAAYAEAVVMIPTFIIIWASILFISDYYEAGMNMTTRLRHCLWRYATDSCKGAKPATCREGGDSQPDDGNFSAIGSITNQFQTTSGPMLPKEASFSAQTSVTLPEALGGSSKTLQAKRSIVCNEERKDLDIVSVFGEAAQMLGGI